MYSELCKPTFLEANDLGLREKEVQLRNAKLYGCIYGKKPVIKSVQADAFHGEYYLGRHDFTIIVNHSEQCEHIKQDLLNEIYNEHLEKS